MIIKEIIHISLLNLIQQKSRNILTAIIVTTGILSLGLLFSYIIWVEIFLATNTVYLNKNGHISIYKIGWEKNIITKSEKSRISDTDVQPIMDKIKDNKQVEFISKSLQGSGILVQEENSTPIILKGYSSSDTQKIRNHPTAILWNKEQLDASNYITDNSINNIMITSRVQQKMGKSKSTEYQIMAKSDSGLLSIMEVKKISEFTTGLVFDEDYAIQCSLFLAQNLFQTDGYTAIHIFLKDRKYTDKILKIIQKEISIHNLKVEAISYKNNKISYYYDGSVSFLYCIGGFFFFLISSVIIIALWNSTRLSLFERLKEIGILQTIGFTEKSIFYIFLFESMFTTLIGIIFGIWLGWSVSFLINHLTNIRFTPPGIVGSAKFTLFYDFTYIIPIILSVFILSSIFVGCFLKRSFTYKITELLGK